MQATYIQAQHLDDKVSDNAFPLAGADLGPHEGIQFRVRSHSRLLFPPQQLFQLICTVIQPLAVKIRDAAQLLLLNRGKVKEEADECHQWHRRCHSAQQQVAATDLQNMTNLYSNRQPTALTASSARSNFKLQ